MTKYQSLIAPIAGIAVGAVAVAAFGAAFGILVGIGLATVTVIGGSLIVGA